MKFDECACGFRAPWGVMWSHLMNAQDNSTHFRIVHLGSPCTTDQEKDKLIVEALGVAYVTHFGKSIGIFENGKPVFIPNLATPEGFFWTWERAQKMEWWDEFNNWLFNQSKKGEIAGGFYIHPTRFRDALAEFLEGRK